jgi:hypothetical protein
VSEGRVAKLADIGLFERFELMRGVGILADVVGVASIVDANHWPH